MISMLSYQHIYHAGCIADVHKHSILSIIFSHLILKDRPITYFETHAGRGLYDLSSPEAQKTGEAKMGIDRVLKENFFAQDHPFMRVINQCHLDYGKNIYPGSAFLAEYFLRANDQIQLIELHPKEILFLKQNLKQPNIHIHFRDGYEGVLAMVPPNPRRGFVFIDPSYEVKNEYMKVLEFIKKIHRKWPEGIIGLWYPKLKMNFHESMVQQIIQMNLKNTLVNELDFADINNCKGMYGSGMVFINCPFGLDADIKNCTNILADYYPCEKN